MPGARREMQQARRERRPGLEHAGVPAAVAAQYANDACRYTVRGMPTYLPALLSVERVK